MPRRAPTISRGPGMGFYYGLAKGAREEEKENTAQILKEEREARKELLDRATYAALGASEAAMQGDDATAEQLYRTAETYAELGGWPIERQPTVAPPKEGVSGMIRGPGEADSRAMFMTPDESGAGVMTPADKSDPTVAARAILARFAADKGLPVGEVPAKMGKEETMVERTPGGYKRTLGPYQEPEKPKLFGKGEWPQTYFNAQGEPKTVQNEKEARAAIKQGYHAAKIEKPTEKDEAKYKKYPYDMYKTDGTSRKVRDPIEEQTAREDGFWYDKPPPKELKDAEVEAQNLRFSKLKEGIATLLKLYQGVDTILQNLSATKEGDFEALLNVARNAYERLKAKAADDKDPRAVRDLARIEGWVDELSAIVGEPKKAGTQALGGGASDYIKRAKEKAVLGGQSLP